MNEIGLTKVSTKQLKSMEIGESRIFIEIGLGTKNAGAQSQAYAHRAGVKIQTKACLIVLPDSAETIKAVIVTLKSKKSQKHKIDLESKYKRLLDISHGLRNQLHGFREVYDESDTISEVMISTFDQFIFDYEETHCESDDPIDMGWVGKDGLP